MHVVGTAGHVDHGKSSLVRALTGVNPDRWLEEQRRGMTLDLGFAPLSFADGTQAGIIDVPGHERFLHNMLAGAAGMEVVLLVIAANEGVKPQTLEHLAILRYLNVAQTLIVLSKIDTVSANERSHVQSRLREDLQDTIAAGAAVLPVSTVTGAGVEDLRAALHAALQALPERSPDAPAYLPIDRVFALAGHGTIVTGTLLQGRIAVGETLWLSPLERSVRIRSLQVFGEKRDRAGGGTRVAVNLPGVERTEIRRGAVLASSQFTASTRLAVRFTPLTAALEMLKRSTPVRAYIGAAEILATLVFDSVPTRAIEINGTLHLRESTVTVPGAPFVVRRVSPMNVLGGGTIAAANAAVAIAAGAGGDSADTLAVIAALTNAGLAGAAAAALGAVANLSEDRVKTVLAGLTQDGRVIVLLKPPAYIRSETAAALLARALDVLEQRQRERPWHMGMTSLALGHALGISEPVLMRVLAAYVEAGRLVYRSGYYSTLAFRPQLSIAQRSFFDSIFSAGANAPVAFEELRNRMRVSNVADISAAFETLVVTGVLSKVGDTIYRGEQIATIRTQLERALQKSGEITVAQFRDVTGSSRKYAVPLLEFFDATGVTIRSGDVRTLRRR